MPADASSRPLPTPRDVFVRLERKIMSRTYTPSSRWPLGWALASVVVLFTAGCGGSDALIGDFLVNTPPETEVTMTPPVLNETSFTVDFFWSGSDSDGQVKAYEWRISNNGADRVVDIEDTLGLAWNYTEATDSTFLVTADLRGFEPDVNNPAIPDSADWRFWETHTFFVRAIDDQGARDPSPARVSFTATTVAPEVIIDLPQFSDSNSCGDGPLALRFGWTGKDPDNPEGDPAFARFLLLEWGGPSVNCLTRDSFNATNPIAAAPDSLWSDWIPYDAPLDSGVTVTFPAFPKSKAGTSFFFAVQVRDVAGAVTATFEWGRNVRHLRVTPNKFPQLTVTERFLGTKNFLSTSGLEGFEIVSEQEIQFSWSADAESYGGVIEAFRYGFNVVDPDDPNDKGWAVPWGTGPNWQRTAPRKFSQGSPNFVVQVRDNSGSISRAVYQFQVIQVAERENQRDLLFIDDYTLSETSTNIATKAQWRVQWEELLSGVKDFQPTDFIDVQTQNQRLNFATINEYKAVVWFLKNNEDSFMRTQLAPRQTNQPRFNWLEAYQNFVGNVLLVGPGAALSSLEPSQNTLVMPLVLDTRDGGTLGLGSREGIDGSEINIGTERWPYSGWCLETIDMVRPAFTQVYNEPAGRPARTRECAAVAYAFPTDDFLGRYQDATAIRDLIPTTVRAQQKAPEWTVFSFDIEEFYNTNVTRRDVQLFLRDCQRPMFTMVARRDVDDDVAMAGSRSVPPLGAQPPLVANEANCPSLKNDGLERSPLTGAPIAIVSSAYSDAKQDGALPTQDFLWGFHPLAFERPAMKATMDWILLKHWGLNLQ